MEDDILTIRDLAYALQLLGRGPGLVHDQEGTTIVRLGYLIEQRANALERQRREAAGQTAE